ncbi:glycosyltransferase [Paraburkholderia susongensis]|uniref:Glycosyltransferase involved in cell wall bisynthesis n=1 Tax=Paraburkholderia susongensis TaxID=1515439 RepID=A0A1X7I3D3_9BURK|nr:glycosyltransferase [Paraburkholderia susongensis]SMG08982.1 Glycosyltransferase involved in cell wall bisynthesis [Paraburkholderia susongensis]
MAKAAKTGANENTRAAQARPGRARARVSGDAPAPAKPRAAAKPKAARPKVAKEPKAALPLQREQEQPQPPQSSEPPSAGLPALHEELARLLAACTTLSNARMHLAEVERLAAQAPDDKTVRIALLQVKERTGLSTGLLAQWADLLRDCPDDLVVARHYATRLLKERRVDEAMALADSHFPDQPDDPRKVLTRAEFLSDIKAHDASDALFRRVIAEHDRRDLRVAFAKRLAKRGMVADAIQVIEPVAHELAPESKGEQLVAKIIDDYTFYRRFESAADLTGQDIKIVAMRQAILRFRERVVSPPPRGKPASVALVTGSLGPGGAERQLTRLAVHLQRLAAESAEVAEACENAAGRDVRAVEVLVKQHSDPARVDRPQRLDFFLGMLLDADVKVSEINAMPAISAAHQEIHDADLLRMLGNLPPQVHYGVTRLAPYLRERAFDVVSLWQDGTCLFGALAALLAGVPTIHLVFRGLPPNIRQERNRPEYAVFYRAIAEVPGIEFVSNSMTGAREYAQWLGLPLERFRILYNGVPEMNTLASEQDEHKWTTFVERTSDATETIGGVFRLEPDKRPLLWIKLAHRYLKRRPLARFVIVGDGRFSEEAEALATELGIAGRLLLVGLSSHVGFWYSKMDVKVLLSRHEGLPNVLIEAQLLGICTVSTPAGGAGECFIDGVTGHLLACAENPDLNDACEKIEHLVLNAQADSTVRERATQRATELFSVEAMLETFMGLCRRDEPVDESPRHVEQLETLVMN